jgi:GNAT superfamily N-acetyltransferase
MIRRALVKDAARLAEIHVFGWRCAYRGIVSDSFLFGEASVEKRISAFSKAISEGKEETYVFDDEGIIKALMTIGNSRNEDKKDSFELWGIYVEPCMTGGGIGTRMLAYCEQEAVKRGFRENFLWVFKENYRARKFYEKMGYAHDGKEELLEKFNALEIRYCKSL